LIAFAILILVAGVIFVVSVYLEMRGVEAAECELPVNSARPGMRLVLAKLALGGSVLLFFAGFLLLCYCPGWYATAAVLASAGAVLGTANTRFWSTLMLLVSLAWTVMHCELKIADDQRWRGVRLEATKHLLLDK
jgi:hypothetical protein